MQTANPAERARGVFTAEVVSNRPICREHYRLVVGLTAFPPTRPGQFVQVQCRPLEPPTGAKVTDWPAGRPPRLTQPELSDTEPFLRRPISLAGRKDRADGGVARPGSPQVELAFIYRVVGTGTRWLAGLGAGDAVSVLGPLGNGFTIHGEARGPVLKSEIRNPKSEIESGSRAAVVGGGVGIPPLIYLAEALSAAGKKVTAFVGARTADLLPLTLVPQARVETQPKPSPCIAEFAACGALTVVASDDGSLGYRGLVSDAFARWLGGCELAPQRIVVYACGPEAMMKAVAAACAARDVECQLALERHMACGMGTCQSCVVKTKADAETGWKFSLCCTDGPVFDARDVLW